jgi:hypothetical protein
VEDIRETDTGIVLSLKASATQEVGIDQDIEVKMDSRTIDGISSGEAVRRFKERLSSWEETKRLKGQVKATRAEE